VVAGLTVQVGGADVVSHVGTAQLRMLGDKGRVDRLTWQSTGTVEI
jgi:hypothetical protein